MKQMIMPHTFQMNPSHIKMSKEGLSHLKQITWLHSHSNNHHLRKAARKTPSSMDHNMTKKRVHRAVLQSQQMLGPQDQPPQYSQHKLEDCHKLPQATNTNINHQDPPECNYTNGSTKAPTNGKGPGATKSKKASTNADPVMHAK